MGYKRIGFVGSTEDSLTITERLKGFCRALKKHGLPVEKKYIQLGEFKQESGYRIIERMIAEGNYPRAIFAENDLLALGVLQGIKASGGFVGPSSANTQQIYLEPRLNVRKSSA